MTDYILRLPSTLSPDELTTTLRQYEPWSIRIDFDNGVSTKDLERRVPFSENPLQKLALAARHLPIDDLRGGTVLDIGCNSGYNSIHAATEWGMTPTGIDFNPRHITVSTMLAEAAGVTATFVHDSAETFSKPASFDLVMHFGTLYHLPNPLLALERAYENLKPGGHLALETQVYDHPSGDENICYFMHMQNNDPTNFWALSPSVLERYLGMVGFTSIETVIKVQLAILEDGMSRTILVAKKPS